MPLSSLPYSAAELTAMLENLQRQAAREGLDFTGYLESATKWNTHMALTAGAYAQAEEPHRFDTFHLALFYACFTEGKDLSDLAIIASAAAAAGLDAARMEAALKEGVYDSTIGEAADEARRRGITGVPTFILGNRRVVVGAQPSEALRKAVEEAAAGMG